MLNNVCDLTIILFTHSCKIGSSHVIIFLVTTSLRNQNSVQIVVVRTICDLNGAYYFRLGCIFHLNKIYNRAVVLFSSFSNLPIMWKVLSFYFFFVLFLLHSELKFFTKSFSSPILTHAIKKDWKVFLEKIQKSCILFLINLKLLFIFFSFLIDYRYPAICDYTQMNMNNTLQTGLEEWIV